MQTVGPLVLLSECRQHSYILSSLHTKQNFFLGRFEINSILIFLDSVLWHSLQTVSVSLLQ
jgi:hypothetical protein